MGRPAEDTTPQEELSDEEVKKRNLAALAMIEGWAKESPDYNKQTLEELRAAIQESRNQTGFRLPDPQ